MATFEIRKARGALHACVFLALVGLGCGELPTDDKNLDLHLPAPGAGGATGAGTTSATGGASGAGGRPSSGTSMTTSTGAGGAPGMSAAGCKMREDEKQVCVVCTDARGNVVRDGCYTKDPKPAGDDCYDIKRVDGSLCTVCFDAKGAVTKSSCRAPNPNTCVVPPPPGPPVTCKDYEEKGVRCVVCHDQFGKEVKRDCPVSPPPGEISCEETKRADGTVCSTCKDAKGVVVKEGCTMPMPAPDPMGVKCGEIDDMGKRCTVCWDAQGKEIKRGCWETMGGTPTPVDPPTCKEYRSEDGAMCVICTDAKGTVVKQGCSTPGAPATR